MTLGIEIRCYTVRDCWLNVWDVWEFFSGMSKKSKRRRLENKAVEAARRAEAGAGGAEVVEVQNAPGGIMDCLDNFWTVTPESCLTVEPKWNVVSGNDLARSGTSKGTSWDNEKQKLVDLGKKLDVITPEDRWDKNGAGQVLWKPTWRDNWIEENLTIRTKTGESGLFKLNRVQREYSRLCLENLAKQNIVLKARQLGITSYIAARFFVQTVTRKGTLTMLVAHDREAAEDIFRIVHRFWNNLSDKLQTGPLMTSHSSARELVFPRMDSTFMVATADENAGRGRTIQNLHCTEVSRWGREAEEALASLRAAVCPKGEIVLESTANGAWGPFYQEWQQAEETGYARHFFPWWFEESYTTETGPTFEMTEEETTLAAEHGLTPKQIGWRRQERAALRGLAGQEFAEDAVACFRTSGECVFELDAIDNAVATAPDPIMRRCNNGLSIWLPPQPGKQYVIGVDPAGGGVEGDYSCAQVIERSSGTQCAELHGHFSLKELCNKLVELARDYNSGLLVVERNNHGTALLVHLRHTTYHRIYEQSGEDGWLTTKASRPLMIERSDIKRNVYDRIVTAVIAFAVSAVIALHDHLLPR
jgi:hypothetical protein